MTTYETAGEYKHYTWTVFFDDSPKVIFHMTIYFIIKVVNIL